MSKNNSFKDYIVEDVLGHIDGITSKPMFSGHGIYLDGVIVCLIIDGEFYLKTDKKTKPARPHDNSGAGGGGLGEAFQYDRKGKMVALPYAIVPIEILEDREKIEELIYTSFDISKKAKK